MMTCDECKALLLPLVEGDLPPEQAEAVRRAAEAYPECGEELRQLQTAMRMASALPVATPPDGLQARLMQAARDHARSQETPVLPAGPVPSRVSESSIVRGWLHFVERFASSPQFGMATIMVLLVAGTFWVVPNLPHKHGGMGDSVTSVAPPPAAAPPAEALSPAEELDLAVDMRRGRLRQRGEVARRARPAGAAEAPPTAEQAVEVAQADDPMATPPSKHKQGPSEPDLFMNPYARGPASAADEQAAGASAARAKAVFAAPPSPAGQARSAAPGSTAEANAEAKKDQAPAPAWEAPLEAARKARAGGACVDAVVIYDTLLARKDLPPKIAHAVLLEAIDCHQRLGNQPRVEALRESLGPLHQSKRKSAPARGAIDEEAFDAFEAK